MLRDQAERNPKKDEIEALNLTKKDIHIYFYDVDGNRYWFQNSQKVSDIIEQSKWTRNNVQINNSQPTN